MSDPQRPKTACGYRGPRLPEELDGVRPIDDVKPSTSWRAACNGVKTLQYILSIPSLDGEGHLRGPDLDRWCSGPDPGSPGGQVKFDIK